MALIVSIFAPQIDLSGLDSSDSGIEFFEKRIRPLLAERCIECHGPEKQKGGLRLDFKQGWEVGGDSGPALVPGDLTESRIIHAIHYEDADFQMPPKSKLSDEAIADLEEWIAMGAPDPRSGAVADSRESGLSVEEGREFWSFKPIEKPKVPAVEDPFGWIPQSTLSFGLLKKPAALIQPKRLAASISSAELISR